MRSYKEWNRASGGEKLQLEFIQKLMGAVKGFQQAVGLKPKDQPPDAAPGAPPQPGAPAAQPQAAQQPAAPGAQPAQQAGVQPPQNPAQQQAAQQVNTLMGQLTAAVKQLTGQ